MEKNKKHTYPFKYFIAHLKPHKYRFVFVLALFAVGGFVTFYNPIITKNIVDKGVNEKDIAFVKLMLILQLSLFVGSSIFDLIRSWLLVNINNRFSISILNDFLIKLTRLPISFFDKKFAGDLQQRMSDHYRIQFFLTSNSVTFIVSIISFAAYTLTLAWFSKFILCIIFSFSVLEILWILYFQKKRKELDYAKFYNLSSNQDNVYEIIMGMHEIKLNNAERVKIANWHKTQLKLAKLNEQSMQIEQKQFIGSSLLDQFQNVIISFVAAYSVINGKMSLGMMFSIGVISSQLKGTITQFFYLIKSYQDASISVNRLMEIHDKETEDEVFQTDPDHKIGAIERISINDLSYQYNADDSLALKNINLSIERGKTIAIVGNSGSGKTTLIKLLLKYYQPTTGSITINNRSLQTIPSSAWREKCGVIMQDGYIFSNSVAENISMNSEKPDHDRLLEAAKAANILDFVESLPEKWNTIIGANGKGLSGGQKQRILIARAIYKNPELLLFDEATSSLDSENEKIITENIDRLFKNKTKIIIAHRFSTIKNADMIIVMDAGEIVETGTHNELMALNKKYFALLSNQMHLNETEQLEPNH